MKASENSDQKGLAIIGMGCLFPKADNLEAYWANILKGTDAITGIPETHWRAEDYCGETSKATERLCSARGGFISPVEFNPLEFGIPPNAIEAIDTSQLLSLVITQRALKDSGYGPGLRPFDSNRVSVIMGVTGTLELVIPLGARLGHPIWRKCLKEAGIADEIAEDVVRRIAGSYVPWQENSFPGLLGNVVAGRIAKHFDLGGTNCIIDAACASSLSALHLSALELFSGRSDMVITGGVDTFNDVFMFTCFNETQALSPSGDARPFDVRADGTILGEGLGILVLKRLEDARRDKDRVYAVIRGIGTSSDGKEQAIYAPNPEGQARALRNAYQDANITPNTIELIEAHGTGTKAGDLAELTGLTKVYKPSKNGEAWCALGSVKSQIGHTKAAAGMAGIIKAAMALHHKVLPPTIKVNQPMELFSSKATPFYVNTQRRPWLPREGHPRRAGVSSFGFGGSNFHCVMEEYASKKTTIDWDECVQILCFSAQTRDDLKTILETWPDDISWQELKQRAETSRGLYDNTLSCRLLMVFEKDRTDWVKAVSKARAMFDAYPQKQFWSTPDGAYFGSGPASGKLGILFPGQGSQYVGMFRDLACRFPQMQQALVAAEEAYEKNSAAEQKNRLADTIFPHSIFSEEEKEANDQALRATQIAQPAIGAVSLGALNILEYFGIKPDAAAGHSYGELTALCASGRTDASAFFSLSMLRGQLMAQGSDDKGSMLAIQASSDLTEQIIDREKLDLVIANKNAPNQMVLSGATEEIKRAALAFDTAKVRNRFLPVSGAFHSPLVAHVRQPFLSALKKTAFTEAKIPVFANSTAAPYPSDLDETRNILSNQLVNPVEFIHEIENMHAHGVRTFLEVGPGAKLTGLIKSIMKGNDCAVHSMDASSGKHSGLFDLASSLAFLTARGYSANLDLWAPGIQNEAALTEQNKPRMTIPICGANHMNPKTRKESLTASKPQLSNNRLSETTPPSARKPSETLSESGQKARKSSGSSPSALTDALRLTQENMAGLQKLQEQTNQLHKQFLEGQAAAQRTFQALVEQQHHLINASLGEARSPKEIHFNPSVPLPDPVPTQPTHTQMKSPEKTTESKGSEEPPQPKIRAEAPLTEIGPEIPTPLPGPGQDILQIEKVLMEAVAEKTGYPAEMLELDMELDADLGIDSIKRVEILSDVQEKLPEAPLVKPEHLGSLKTLRHIVDFLSGPSASMAPSDPPKDLGPSMINKESSDDRPSLLKKNSAQGPGIERSILALKKLNPTEKRRPVSISERTKIWVTDEDSGLASAICRRLRLLNFLPELISPTDLNQSANQKDISGLVILSPAYGAGDLFLKNSFKLLKHAGPFLKNTSEKTGSILITVSRLDGCFGLTSLNGQDDPASGGIAGILKTARHEWPEVNCKALDLANDYGNMDDAAKAIVEEMLLSGPIEVGLSSNGRHTLHLIPSPIETIRAGAPPAIGEKDVVVISGGGRGVTAEVAAALASKFKSTMVLLGRSPVPGPEPDWLAMLSKESDIKKKILSRTDKNLSLKQVEEQYGSIMANRELLRNISRIESIGSRVIYYSTDIRDDHAIQSVLAEVRDQVGPIKGLVHGAGVIEDRLIEDKTEAQFDRVYTTKVAGLKALLRATGQDDLKILVLFSSFTGRYGRSGQIDYAAANEVLNKFAQQQSRLRKDCRVVAVNWGPWAGGMVNPSLRRVFEQQGIGLIDLEEGADYLIREICSNGDRPVEVVVMGKRLPEFLQKDTPQTDVHQIDDQPGPSLLSAAFERQLRIEDHPFLKSHVMNGRAVLPMAIMIEWMAHGALHGNPGMKFAGFDNLRVLRGLTLDSNEFCNLKVSAGKAVKRGDTRMAAVELISSNGNNGGRVHARAEIALVTGFSEMDVPIHPVSYSLGPYPLEPDEIYNNGRLFHGPDFQGIEKVVGYSENGISAIAKAAPLPSAWIKRPLRNTWLADPLILDSSFQLMILWSLEKNGMGSLPSFAGHYRQFETAYPKEGTKIVVHVSLSNDHKAVADMDFVDPVKDTLIARLEGYECVMDASLNQAFRQNHLAGPNEVRGEAIS